ncbi:transmembrane protein, putative (macronuclear) [Tetrahymena thermophila SB210]|uniref:Transmembrane protein, putative n=1 Tax=Tetrahymena thermophila (strain SB210) TaxID=312017 RepID=I7MMR3_TETTS|nr:transmembrane protein, putative [Tetrahymena thermophila SB210]EAS06247.2 transmembrane protein, putative [Tetrahymena thermophila SB210]|eukprot:XP_001026492.2 transmembrane protein, putative [Tetrahymena thermophila SB210]
MKIITIKKPIKGQKANRIFQLVFLAYLINQIYGNASKLQQNELNSQQQETQQSQKSNNISQKMQLTNVDLQITLSPNEQTQINLDSLLADQGIQRDNYQFSDLQLVNEESFEEQVSGEIRTEYYRGDRILEDLTLEQSCLQSSQVNDDYLISYSIDSNLQKLDSYQFPLVVGFQKHIQIQQTKINLFVSTNKLLFTEKYDDQLKTFVYDKLHFQQCHSITYFSKDTSNQVLAKTYRFLVLDCDISESSQAFIIINITSVTQIDDISDRIISTSNQSQVCKFRQLITMVFQVNVINQIYKDLFIQYCVLVNKTEEPQGLYIQEVKVNDNGQLQIEYKQSVDIQNFVNNPIVAGTDVTLTNMLFFFFDNVYFRAIATYYLLLDKEFKLVPISNKNVYGNNFSTGKFVLMFNTNPLERRNYLMYTTQELESDKSNDNLYILDITQGTNIQYISKKILIPNHIIDQTLVTRDFIVVRGHLNCTNKNIIQCKNLPQENNNQFIAIYSIKENRYNIHFYKIYQTSNQLLIDGCTDNYVVNNFMIIDTVTGVIEIYQINDNYLKLAAGEFTKQTSKLLQFKLKYSNLIQQTPDEVNTMRILITFAQTKQSIQLSDDGVELFQEKPIKRDDLYFQISLDNIILGPQIEYLLIKDSHQNQKYQATINNFLKYDLLLDLSGRFKDIPYRVILTHVTNANFNQIQIFTEFCEEKKNYDIMYHICTLNKEKQNQPCQRQQLANELTFPVKSLKLYQSSNYVGLIEKNDASLNNKTLVFFYNDGKNYKYTELDIDNIQDIDMVDLQYVGILRPNLQEIIVIQINVNPDIDVDYEQEDNQKKGFGSIVSYTIVSKIDIDFFYKQIIKFSMKLFQTRSIIFIHTDDNKIRIQGVFWKKGYSNSPFRFAMNTVSQLQLEASSTCRFTVFNYPNTIIVCVNEFGESSIRQYILNQEKTLAFQRQFNLFQYKIGENYLSQSYIDKVFFYQKAYYIDVDQRTTIETLLVFDPQEISTNILKTTANLNNKIFNVPFDIESTYGSYMLYSNGANSNQVQIVSINNNPSLSFNVIPSPLATYTEVNFNLTFYALSNYTQSSIIRNMEISTNIKQFMIVGKQTYSGWRRVNSENRFAQINIPEDIFSGPLRKIVLLNTTDIQLVNETYITQSEQDSIDPILQGEDIVLRNRYYITLSQFMIQSQSDKEMSYVDVQKNLGQIIDSAYNQQEDLFVFLTQKSILFMSGSPSDNSKYVYENNLNKPINYNYSQCNLIHHKYWNLFIVICKNQNQNQDYYEIHAYNYTLGYDTTLKNTAKNGGQENENSFEDNFQLNSISNIQSIDTSTSGIIQQTYLSQNQNTPQNIDQLLLFTLSKLDKNFQETVVIVSKIIAEQLNTKFIINANALNRRFLYLIDFSVLQFSSEIEKEDMFLISLLAKDEIIFVIYSQQRYIYRASYKIADYYDSPYQTIDLYDVKYNKKNDGHYLTIKFILQYSKKDAIYAEIEMYTKVLTEIPTQWNLSDPKIIEKYSHYKTCIEYSSKPVAFWDTEDKNLSPKYLARSCIFNQLQAQSSIGSETTSKSFHLILYSNKEGKLQSTQTVIELPFYNSRPSTIFFYNQIIDNQKQIHMLVTSYINLFIDYLIQNSYSINLYFKDTQQYLISQKRILVQGENDHFRNYAPIDYFVIDYMIQEKQQRSYLMLYVKIILSLGMLIIYLVPIISMYLQKVKCQSKQIQMKEDLSPRFQVIPKKKLSDFVDDIRNQSPENPSFPFENQRYTYEPHMSTPSQYVINSNTDDDKEDSDNELY